MKNEYWELVAEGLGQIMKFSTRQSEREDTLLPECWKIGIKGEKLIIIFFNEILPRVSPW